MTKRWSSTRSLDGNTKRGASKEERAEQKRILAEEMLRELVPDVQFVDVTPSNNKGADNG